jgi:hypothetical protein
MIPIDRSESIAEKKGNCGGTRANPPSFLLQLVTKKRFT